MRAAVLHRAGAPPEPGSWPEPVPGEAESLLAVEAAPISPLDLLLASGVSYFGPPPLPSVPRVQGVGRVLASGSLPVGARVWFQAPARSASALGALAEQTVDLRQHPDPEALRQAFLAASPEGYDLVLDPLCGPPADAALVTLRPGGRFVNLGSAAGPALQAPSTVLRSRSLSVLGYTNASLTPAETMATLAKVFDLAAGGVLRVRTETHALERVTAAWQRAAGEAPGRVVVLVDPAAS